MEREREGGREGGRERESEGGRERDCDRMLCSTFFFGSFRSRPPALEGLGLQQDSGHVGTTLWHYIFRAGSVSASSVVLAGCWSRGLTMCHSSGPVRAPSCPQVGPDQGGDL